jgi:YidC/Oxa1 family membrane protein insertase
MAQLELYKKHNINPASGCLPQIINLIILIGLYRVLIEFLGSGQINGSQVNISFLWMNLGEPDKSYITPLIAGAAQFFMALMLAPATDTSAEKLLASKTPTKSDDKKAEDMTDMASSMQQQMLFIMPIMTTVLALRFPSGVTVYWIITTLFSIVQQYFISGWGGVERYAAKVFKNKK